MLRPPGSGLCRLQKAQGDTTVRGKIQAIRLRCCDDVQDDSLNVVKANRNLLGTSQSLTQSITDLAPLDTPTSQWLKSLAQKIILVIYTYAHNHI